MKTFKEIRIDILESTGELDELMAINKEIEVAFNKEFPQGWIAMSVGKKTFGSVASSFKMGIIGDNNQLTGGYGINDPAHHGFMIFQRGPDDFEVRNSISGLSVNPPEGSYLVMKHMKTGFRQIKSGNSKKVTKAFSTFFKKLKGLVKANEAEIYQRDKYDDKYFK